MRHETQGQHKLIPIDEGMALIRMIERCSDWCRTTHPGRLICPEWRPGEVR